MRELASHQCVPGSIHGRGVICGLSLLLVLFLAPRVFLRVLQFSSLLKNQYFQIPIRSGIRGPRVYQLKTVVWPLVKQSSFILFLFYLFILSLTHLTFFTSVNLTSVSSSYKMVERSILHGLRRGKTSKISQAWSHKLSSVANFFNANCNFWYTTGKLIRARALFSWFTTMIYLIVEKHSRLEYFKMMQIYLPRLMTQKV